MKILIIGNSAAGTAAIEAIRRNDPQSSIVQLSDEPHPLYSRCLLSFYLAGGIPKKALLYRDANFHKKMNVELHVGKRAVRLDTDRQQVECNDGSVYAYDKLLISTGASATLPDNIPKEIDGVHVLRTLDDAEALKMKAAKAKRAVVLGGGLIGIKVACALRECGLETRVVVRSNHILSQMIDFEASQIITKRLFENKIDVLTQTDICEIQSRKNKLVAVKTDHGQVIPCELIVVAKGVRPNTELVRQTDIKKRWGIETNPYMQTNHQDIFAAGDVAETFDITTEEYAINALWTCAVQQGHVAGMNMIDQKIAYDGTLGMNALNVCDIPLISFGITSPENDSKYRTLIQDKREHPIYKKIVLDNHRIKGIILVGKIENAGVLLSLIQQKVDVSPFEDELLSDPFNFGRMLRTGDPSILEKYQKC